jgi:hypothetical protein
LSLPKRHPVKSGYAGTLGEGDLDGVRAGERGPRRDGLEVLGDRDQVSFDLDASASGPPVALPMAIRSPALARGARDVEPRLIITKENSVRMNWLSMSRS